MAELVDERERDRAIARYGQLEERFAALGGYAAESEAARICANLGLEDRILNQPLRTLSGGQRRRIELARILFAASEAGAGGNSGTTLLLDEPTNHLDIPSCEALEEALQDFPGTVIMVSHDRYLLNKLADQLLYLDGEGNCTAFDGTYEEFEISQEAPKELQPAAKPALPKPKAVPDAPEKPNSNGQKFSKNELAKLRNRCEFLEQEIQRIEALIESNTRQLSDPDVARDFVQFKQLTDQHEDLSTKLSQLYQDWEKSLKLLETT
jgi:ATPase subunit of ABC transporter with duplicated ATPase domains